MKDRKIDKKSTFEVFERDISKRFPNPDLDDRASEKYSKTIVELKKM